MTAQTDNLFKAFGLFIEAFRLYIVALLMREADEKWAALFFKCLSHAQQESWEIGIRNGSVPETLIDYHHLRSFAIEYKLLLRPDFQRKTGSLPTWLQEIAEVRHKLAHYLDIDDNEAAKAWIHMTTIAKMLKMNELEAELIRLQNQNEEDLPPTPEKTPSPLGRAGEGFQDLSETSPPAPLRRRGETPSPLGRVGEGSSARLRPWFEVVQPHQDISMGRLDESVFAANLAEVALGNGREIYSNPVIFFSKTFFTAGLKNIAKRVIRGLNGGQDSENRVISLQTGFGGGKTHTLISLFHLAKWGKKAVTSPCTQELFAATGAPEFDSAQIAVFTNTTNDPAQGRRVEDFTIRTLWGELAYQLGGKTAYDLIRVNDEQRIAPKGLFKNVLAQCKPALILIDELADYCVSAAAVKVAGSNLSDQTVSFMQELTEAIAGADHCVLIATLPASAQELAASPVSAQILTALENRITRVGANLKPVEDDEIFEVVRRRLFEDSGHAAEIESVVSAYMQMYQTLQSEIPAYALQTDFRNKLKKSYPFHPELIDMFRLRWAGNPFFQRTRGVLRILAAIVADLWKRQASLSGSQYLIHTSDVMFANVDALTGQITMLHGPNWDSVISADVSGTSSNAFRIDHDVRELGQHHVTQGIAATILLGTFGAKGQNKGVGIDEIKLCMLAPAGFNHNDINGAIDRLEGIAHYLYYSDARHKRYWFDTTPNINILINQAKGDISKPDVSAEILRRVKESAKGAQFFNILVNPSADIPEQMRPTLIILSPLYAVDPHNFNGDSKLLIEQLATKKGNSERIYRNTMLFLVCSEMGVGKLQDDVKNYLACQKIHRDYASQLSAEQKADIHRRIEQAAKQAEHSLVAAYSLVARYSVKQGIDHFALKEFADKLETQINNNLLTALKQEEWLLGAVGMNTLRQNNLLPSPQQAVNVKDIYEAFLRFDDKPMIVGSSAVQESLLKYCYNGEYCIATGDGSDFSRFFLEEQVPFFDVTDVTYWLVDKSLKPNSRQPTSVVTPLTDGKGNADGVPVVKYSPDKPGTESVRQFKSITIAGKVPLERYTELFNYFITPFAMNGNTIGIEVKFTIKAGADSPLDESKQHYKSAKEAAKQLELYFNEEEI